MRIFENRALSKILGFKRNEETEELRRLHKEKFYDLCLSNLRLIKSRIKALAVHVEVWETRQVHTVTWWGDLKENRTLGRPSRRREGNFKLDLQEVVEEDMDWIDLGQDRYMWPTVLNAVMNTEFHKMRGISLTSCSPVKFSGSNLLHGVR